jgi:hypothetical protein
MPQDPSEGAMCARQLTALEPRKRQGVMESGGSTGHDALLWAVMTET